MFWHIVLTYLVIGILLGFHESFPERPEPSDFLRTMFLWPLDLLLLLGFLIVEGLNLILDGISRLLERFLD